MRIRIQICVTEPAHAEPGGGEDWEQTTSGSGEVLPAGGVSGPPPPVHPYQRANRHVANGV